MTQTLHNYLPKYLDEELFLSLYQDIKQFRRFFDLPIETLVDVDAALHASLLTEELLEAFSADTRIDKIDAAVDTVYVMMGHIVNAGLNYQALLINSHVIVNVLDTLIQTGDVLKYRFTEAWDIIHASNLSKLCNDDNLQETQNYYKYNGVPTYASKVGVDPNNEAHSLYAVKVERDCVDAEGNPLSAGKVLKSVDYTPADLSGL